jgi:hypothetical protein
MFARVSTFSGTAEQVDAAIRAGQERILPQARQIQGYQGSLYLVDRTSGKAMAVTFWESEEAMRASEEAADRLRADVAQSLGGEIVSVDRYEVATDERP